MATAEQPEVEQLTPAEIQAEMASIKKMIIVGALFAAVGFLLTLGALVLELTAFHPLLEDYFVRFTEWSLAGGGPNRAGAAGVNEALAEIHKFPSTLLWMKLGGIANILVGIFISLVAIIRTLALVPHRLALRV